MIKLRRILMFSLIMVIAALMFPQLYDESNLTQAAAGSGSYDKQIVRAYFPDRHTANKISISFEGAIIETNYDEKYHYISKLWFH